MPQDALSFTLTPALKVQALWQIQEGKPHLIGYASKTLPEACAGYSVTKLEMTGLLVNIGLWKNILKQGV